MNVVIEFGGTVNVDEISEQEIREIVTLLDGSDVAVVSVEIITDEQHIARVVLSVEDEATAQVIANAINAIINNSNISNEDNSNECDAGVLCRAVKVFVKQLDCAQHVARNVCAIVLCMIAVALTNFPE